MLKSATPNEMRFMSSLKDELLSRLNIMTLMPELKGRGLYMFCMRDPRGLAGIKPGHHGTIYVGATEKSLVIQKRFLQVHSGRAALRRSLGALLREDLKLQPLAKGLQSSKSEKFRFTNDGEARLTEWMNNNLWAAQLEVKVLLSRKEIDLIRELQPPLNLTKWFNPQKAFICERRKVCADMALGRF